MFRLSFRLIRIQGHSMEPAFKPGSFALVRVGAKNLNVGDVVVFKTSSGLSLKRIHNINPQGYYVVGDNRADSIDSRDVGPILQQNVIGKVVWS